MIQVESITRRYGDVTAVDDVCFRIGEREVVGLLGHNGAGKTTIMRMLSGFLEPSAGRILADGRDLTGNALALRQSLGYLPESPPVYPDMMVADYLEFAATLKGIPRAQRLQAVRQVIVATDLGACSLDRIATLSRGFRQRVGVAQAMLGSPRLLILDEPTNGLDPGQTGHMRQLLRALATRATVLLSTHILQEVAAVCDRVLVLRNGRLVLDSTLAALHHSHTLVLRTGGGAPDLAGRLLQLPQVASLLPEEALDGPGSHRVVLHDGVDLDAAAAAVARCALGAGAQLYRLQPLARDLESVFREANTDGS